jgi:two-component system, OmpR family, sensor histidine kinase QseC
MHIKSISRFLSILLLASVTVLVVVVTVWSYLGATHEVEELFDAELAQMARVLQSLLPEKTDDIDHSLLYRSISGLFDSEGDDNEATPWGHKYEKKLAFQVWDSTGRAILGNSADNFELRFTDLIGYDRELYGNTTWRTFSLLDKQKLLRIKVAQRYDVREELTHEIVLSAVLPFLFLLPLLLIIISLVIRQGLSPLNRLSRQIEARNPNRLTPLQLNTMPSELTPVVTAINALIEKVSATLIREREFTSNAAHELRTPLAAIRIHTQNLQACSLHFSAKNGQILNNIITGVDRMSHVVNQLMALRQLEFHHEPKKEPVNLSQLVQQVAREYSPLAERKQQTLHLTIEETQMIQGDSNGLGALCRNLLDNAIRYTPTGGQIEVNTHQEGNRVLLQIIDNGPGIPESEYPKVIERFYRLPSQDVEGSGLGLAIVQEVVSQQGGELSLHAAPNFKTGLMVRVSFTSSFTSKN